MFRPRVIPVLLLKDKGLVKTIKFSKSRYIGDPINAVRIFNDLESDELVFLDIVATKEKRTIDLGLVKEIGDEAYMPFAIGGGITKLNHIDQILNLGAEKIVLNSILSSEMFLINEAATRFGSQSVIASVDVKRSLFGQRQAYVRSGKDKVNVPLIDFIKRIEDSGAGEILINSIDNDGVMNGYDLDLVKIVSENVDIPVIACGGAGNTRHFKEVIGATHASAVAAGSMFVYHGPRHAVLVNYPEKEELNGIFAE